MSEENNNTNMNNDIQDISISREMENSFIDYAMSVIVSRAIPDARDGMKPVHRRILFAMYGLEMVHNKAYKKSARAVGEVIAKYHPHGDSSVYEALVRIINSSNLIIAANGGNDAIPESDAVKGVVGQAKTIRAFA